MKYLSYTLTSSKSDQHVQPSTLSRLITRRKWKQVQRILESAKVCGNGDYEILCNSEKYFDASLLHFMCQYEPPLYIVEELVSAKPDLLVQVDGKNRLPLHIAVEKRAHPVVIEYLLVRNKQTALTQDNEGRTPLHLLFRDYHPPTHDLDVEDEETREIAKSLCKAAPMSAMIEDMNGMSALEYAIENDVEMDIIRILQVAATSKLPLRVNQLMLSTKRTSTYPYRGGVYSRSNCEAASSLSQAA